MKNKYFPDEEITENDLFFMCSMVERVARKLHRRNKYVVNAIGYDELVHLLSCAAVLHCENPQKVADDWIRDYSLTPGDFDITDVDRRLCTKIPTENDMGKVYKRLIVNTSNSHEDYAEGSSGSTTTRSARRSTTTTQAPITSRPILSPARISRRASIDLGTKKVPAGTFSSQNGRKSGS